MLCLHVYMMVIVWLLIIYVVHLVLPAPNHPPTQVSSVGVEMEYLTPTPLPPPPMAVGQPVKEGYESSDQNTHVTQSRGDGFWRGWYFLSIAL